MERSKPRIHRAWFVMIGCCFMQMGTLGILYNCTGVFFPPVCGEFGFTVGEISMSLTIRGIVSFICMPIAGYLLPRYNIRALLSGATVCGVLTMAAMSRFTQLWQWYVAGGLMGLFGSFLFLLPTPIILGNWFKEKRGMATGIALASSGLGGAVMNIVAGSIITTLGWRHAYVTLAVTCAVLALPFTLFVIRFKPADVGLKPYGEQESEDKSAAPRAETGYLRKEAVRTPMFYLMVVAAVCCGFTMIYSQQFPSYGASIGWSIAIGSTMTSLSMVGNVGSKLLMGFLSDRIGVRNCAVAGSAAVALSLVLLLVVPGSVPVAFVASTLAGVAMSMVSVIMPLVVRGVFGGRDYSSIFSLVSMCMSLFASLGVGVVGFLFDVTGSYTTAFALGAALCCVAIVCNSAAYRLAKKRRPVR